MPPRPPTPPDVRFARIRRLNAAVAHPVTARSEESRKLYFRSVALLNAAWTLGATDAFQAPGELCAIFRPLPPDAQGPEVSEAPTLVVPAIPEARANVSANPWFQSEYRVSLFGQPVVSPPAPDIGTPVVSALFARQTLVTFPQLPNLLLEAFQTRWRDFDLSRRVHPEAEELAFPWSSDSALLRFYYQPQFRSDPLAYLLHHPFRRPLTAHVDVAVIGIPAE